MNYTSELMARLLTTDASRRLLTYIAPVYSEAKIALMIFDTIGREIQNLDDAVEEIRLQSHPQTATWCLPVWETEYGITPNDSIPMKERRELLLRTIQNRAPMNPRKLAELCSAACGYETRVEERTGKNKFAVWLLARTADEARVRAVIDKAKPAHLIYEIKFEQVISGSCNFAGTIQIHQNFTLRQGN